CLAMQELSTQAVRCERKIEPTTNWESADKPAACIGWTND
ncbi:hypothetical protein SAMN05444358_11728, partial [Ruegeria halocynthiae]